MISTRLAASLFLTAVLLGAVSLGVLARAAARERAAEAAYPPVGEILVVNGRRVHAIVEGEGPDLVLIHGASGNVRDFTFDLVDRLKDRYRVIAIDRPGLGYTEPKESSVGPRFTGTETLAEQAELLAATAIRLGADRPLVLGQSFGGSVALAWALERPENMSGLVLVSAPSNVWPGPVDFVYRLNGSTLGATFVVPLVTAFLPKSYVDGALERVFAPQAAPDGYAAHIGVPLTTRRLSLRANARQVHDLRPQLRDMAPRYGEIEIPVEILHGTADTIVSATIHSEVLESQIPGSIYTRIENGGHMPHHTATDDVIAAIDRAATRAGLR